MRQAQRRPKLGVTLPLGLQGIEADNILPHHHNFQLHANTVSPPHSSDPVFFDSQQSVRAHDGLCPICQKVFKGRNRHQNLLHHMHIHTGARPYKCPVCPYTGRQHNHIKRHIINQHPHLLTALDSSQTSESQFQNIAAVSEGLLMPSGASRPSNSMPNIMTSSQHSGTNSKSERSVSLPRQASPVRQASDESNISLGNQEHVSRNFSANPRDVGESSSTYVADASHVSRY